MSIHFISGKPGGGKTLYSVRLILDELLFTNRTIVTNVPLKLAALNQYLQENHPKAFTRRFTDTGRHITDDIILLTEDDLPRFFTFRGSVRLQSITNAQWKSGVRPDYSVVNDPGIFFVLDEVHIAFNSRAWAETGAEVLYYLSQHRKLGDDVVCITQSIGNVDKQFRSVAQDFTYIKNLSKQQAGIFRMPAIFTRNTFSQPATDTSKPQESGTFTLDVSGIASLYDTAAGVGIHGRAGADTKSRKKGLSWIIALIGIPIVVIGIIKFGPRAIVKGISADKPTPPASAAKLFAVTNPPAARQFTNIVLAAPVEMPFTNGSELRGIQYMSGVPQAFFSDGSIVNAENGLQQLGKNWVVVNGQKFYIRPKFTELPAYVPPSKNASGLDLRDSVSIEAEHKF